MILESLVTTLDDDGAVHIAAMGPEVSDGFDRFVLRPYQTSRTYANLRRTRQGVLHVTDDVELMARAAIGQFKQLPAHRPAAAIQGAILADACRWYAFEVESIDDREPRASLSCRVVDEGRQRDFLGFNRARHAVIEIAILVTRRALMPPDTLLREVQRLEPLVEKTGGPAERRAFTLLRTFIHEHCEVLVRAPSRLHFGLLSVGNTGRQFGGVGVMVAQPALQLVIRPAREFTTSGTLEDELSACARRCCETWDLGGLPLCHLDLQSAPPRHVGLGSGTQLACAVAAGLGAWYRRPPLSPEDLARVTGRGRRSAVGTYGFAYGGLIVDSGRLPDDLLAPLQRRLDLPAAWRFVLADCQAQAGLSGVDEHQAFAQLPPVSDATRQAMVAEVERHMIPAVLAEDCGAFGASVYRYGRMAGESFAAVQGGPYNGPYVERLVDEIRSLGYAGVGQSSWGPTVFCVVESEDAAQRLRQELERRRRDEHLQIVITAADNCGAVVQSRD